METVTKPIEELSTKELQNLLEERLKKENEAKNKAREDYESLKESTILGLISTASGLSGMLKDFSEKAFSDMEALYDLLCSYSNRHAEGKGNFTVESRDGNMKIVYRRQELGHFDERSVQAEKHIIDFVNSKFTDDADKELFMTILERKKGKLDIKQVQKLYAMEDKFDNENWREGIKLLKESWTPSGSKPYISFFVKPNGDWKQINLNFSSIKSVENEPV